MNVGSGGGAASVPSAGGAGGAASDTPAEEAKKEEKEEGMLSLTLDSSELRLMTYVYPEKEESDEDMGFGLFD